MLTKSQLNEIKERVEKATPGKWVSYIEGRDHTSGSDFIMTGVGGKRGPDIELIGATKADQDFIAHARQDIEILIAELERYLSE
jgi:hypothetical protein